MKLTEKKHKYTKPFISYWIYSLLIIIFSLSSFTFFYYSEIGENKLYSGILSVFYLTLYFISKKFIRPYIYQSKREYNGIENYESFKKMNGTTLYFIKNTKKLHNEISAAYSEVCQPKRNINYYSDEFWINGNKITIKNDYYPKELKNEIKKYSLKTKINRFN
jgi:hypothetical protein